MDRREAKAIVGAELQKYRSQSYEELLRLRSSVEDYSVVGPSGTRYGIEVQAFWDSGRPGNLRVRAAIDDGGISAFLPLCRDFIISPDGGFVGE